MRCPLTSPISHHHHPIPDGDPDGGGEEPPSARAPRVMSSSGIIPRSVSDIFEAARASSASSGVRTTVALSFLQIYNDRIQDLLMPYKQKYTTRDARDVVRTKASLDVREDPDRGTYVPDLTQLKVTSVAGVMSLIRKGNRHRAVRATEMNERSSRSHTILQLTVEQRIPGEGGGGGGGGGSLRRAKLNLVDLAGSERWSSAGDMAGAQITELTSINSSLLALASVVAALSQRTPPGHVRYRDSKLTHLLQDSLGGNCRTAIPPPQGGADITVDQNNLPAYLEAQLRYRLMNRIKAQLLEFLKVRTYEGPI